MIRVAVPLLALVVPIAALWLATPPDRQQNGQTAMPFAWPSLLVVHVACAMPLAGWLAGVMHRNRPGLHPGVKLGIAAVCTVLAFLTVPILGQFLDDLEAAFIVRCVIRTLLCTLLVLPWFMLDQRPVHPWPRSLKLVAVLIALLLPGLHAERLTTDFTAAAQNELAEQNLLKATILLDGLADLDPTRMIITDRESLTITSARSRLANEILRLRTELDRLHPDLLLRAQQIDYAKALLSLNRSAEAEQYLREWSKTVPANKFLLAKALLQQDRIGESDVVLHELLDDAIPLASEKASIRNTCRRAFDRLVENATKQNQPQQREAILLDAIARLPIDAGYFHFQLARHYQLSGQPYKALQHIDMAEKHDVTLKPRTSALRRQIAEQTPACLIGR